MGLIAIWSPLAVSFALALQRSFFPAGDNAGLALRAFTTWSLHPTVLGPFSLGGAVLGKPVFGLGPLYFWVLSPATHLDPSLGFFWGSALIAGVALSLGFIALRSAGMDRAAWLVPLATLLLAWRAPLVLFNLPWNAYLPVLLLVAWGAAAVAVAVGELRWLPLLVVLASLTAQCEFIFVLGLLIASLVALLLGLRHRRGGVRAPLAAGAIAALLCWLPFALGSSRAYANLAAVAKASELSQGMGRAFALNQLGRVLGWPPLLLQRAPSNPGESLIAYPRFGLVLGFALPALLLVTGLAPRRGRSVGVQAAAVILAGYAIGLGFSLARFPNGFNALVSYWYLSPQLWLLGLGSWVTLAAAVVAGLRRWRPAIGARLAVVPLDLLAPLLCLALLVLGSLQLARVPELDSSFLQTPLSRQTALRVVDKVVAEIPPGPVVVRLKPSRAFRSDPSYSDLSLSNTQQALNYALVTRGYRPGIEDPVMRSFDGRAPLRGQATVMSFTVSPGQVRLRKLRRCELDLAQRCVARPRP